MHLPYPLIVGRGYSKEAVIAKTRYFPEDYDILITQFDAVIVHLHFADDEAIDHMINALRTLKIKRRVRMESMRNYEVTEMCPHCETEITLCWDVRSEGYQVFCPNCGKPMMLCSMCDRSPCDWAEKGCKYSNEKYNTVNKDGWIPVDERLPENDGYILLSFENFSIPIVGRYEADKDGGGSFYPGDCDEEDTCIGMDLFVNAWMPLPKPYKEGDAE